MLEFLILRVFSFSTSETKEKTRKKSFNSEVFPIRTFVWMRINREGSAFNHEKWFRKEQQSSSSSTIAEFMKKIYKKQFQVENHQKRRHQFHLAHLDFLFWNKEKTSKFKFVAQFWKHKSSTPNPEI